MVNAISILGCTGSIGRQTAAVAEYTGIRVAALTANRRIDRLEEQARKFRPAFVAAFDEDAAKQLKIALADTDIRVGSGMEGLIEAATLPETDCVVTAVSGDPGLRGRARDAAREGDRGGDRPRGFGAFGDFPVPHGPEAR